MVIMNDAYITIIILNKIFVLFIVTSKISFNYYTYPYCVKKNTLLAL